MGKRRTSLPTDPTDRAPARASGAGCPARRLAPVRNRALVARRRRDRSSCCLLVAVARARARRRPTRPTIAPREGCCHGRRDHPFGTDRYGRDMLQPASSTAPATRCSSPSPRSAISAAGGGLLGLIGGYRGGMVDRPDRPGDGHPASAFPALLLAIAIAAVLTPGLARTRMIADRRRLRPPLLARRAGPVVAEADASTSRRRRSTGASDRRILSATWCRTCSRPGSSRSRSGSRTRSCSKPRSATSGSAPNRRRRPGAGCSTRDGDYSSNAPWLSIFPGLAIMLGRCSPSTSPATGCAMRLDPTPR